MKKKVLIVLCLILGGMSLVYLTNQDKTNFNGANINDKRVNTLAIYVMEDDGTYKETSNIPQSGYAVNTQKSTCSNGSKPSGVTPNITINNLSKSGTSCYLYFDKATLASEIVAKIQAEAKTETPDFSQIADTDEGVYKVEDGMYGNYSYYWRGAATTNHVIFANKCWRIIRINGDGSIRLIYDGATCHENGTNTADSIAVTSQSYGSAKDADGNVLYNNSSYVGYTYTLNSQRPSSSSGTASNLKVQIDNWYDTNIGNNVTYSSKVADGKFCNDREVESGSTWSATGTPFLYATKERLWSNKTPTLACSNSNDIYTLKVGAITADEIAYAGGVSGKSNNLYYLYNGASYWTMTPCDWLSSRASIFYVHSSGGLTNSNVSILYGVRPVINLRSDVTFNSGSDGTQNNPYIVL